MTDTITIKELCTRLNNNEEEKWAFFNGLTYPKFLEPFFRYNVLRFDDSCFNGIINYLITVFDGNAELIAEIINKNIREKRMPANGGFIFKNLLDKFTLQEIKEDIKYTKLFDFRDSIYICASLLNRTDLAGFPEIYLTCIKNLIKYETIEEKFITSEKIPKLFHRQYFFQKVFMASNQLKTILKKKDCYGLLKKEYQKLFNEFGDLSVYSKQYIDPDEVIINEYKTMDVRDIILTFMAIYLQANSVSKEVETLLTSNIPMFVKLGLYAVGTNLLRYKNLFNNFLIGHSNVEWLYQYKYEILTIFEELQEFYNSVAKNGDNAKSPYSKLESTIRSFLDGIPKEKNREKYLFLHGLKTHSKFSKMFNEMKKEFENREIFEPKLFISEPEVYSVHNISFISKQDLSKKSVTEQVEYWNGASKLPSKQLKREKRIVYEENFDGLLDITREIISENIKEYLKPIKNLYKLQDLRVISVFFEVLSKKIRAKDIAKTSFNKIINLIKHYLQNDQLKRDYGFDFDLSELLKSIIIESGENNAAIHLTISNMLQELISQNFNTKDEGEDISFYSINTASGRYWECFITLLDYKKSMTDTERTFLEQALFKTEYAYSEKLMLFHLGVHMNSMLFRLKNYPWEENIYKNLKANNAGCEAFLQGFLSYVTYIEAFKSFKRLILENYSKIKLPSEIHHRFIGLFCDIKFRNTFNESELINDLESVFVAADYNTIIHILALESSAEKFDESRVLKFWQAQVARNIDYSDELVEIPNLYINTEDLSKFNQYLIKMFQLAETSNTKELTPFYLEKFLNNILYLLQNTDESSELTKIFNILDAVISATTAYDYKGEIPNILKLILQEYSKKNTGKSKGNTLTLANKICTTKGLIQYSNLFIEFCE